MKDRIKFSDEMLAAVIDGRKTQTRRLIEPQPKVTEKRLRELDAWQDGHTLSEQVCAALRHGFIDDDCPYGKAGDAIPFADKDGNIKGKIEIVDVWLQQVRDISQEGAFSEGISKSLANDLGYSTPESEEEFNQYHAKYIFRVVWDSICGKGNFASNPWVWVIEFKRIQG